MLNEKGRKDKVMSVQAMKAYRRRGVAPVTLNIDVTLGEWSASRTGRFTPEEALQYQLLRRLVSPRAGVEIGGEKNILNKI
jgi:hypothetical protein